MSEKKHKKRRPLPLGLAILARFFGMIGRLLATFIMVGIITGCIVACVLTVYILRYIGADNRIDLQSVKMGYTSIIYATDPETGEDVVLRRLYVGGEDRTWVDYQDISEYTKLAIVAVEDKRFWAHDGVDWRRTVVAFVGMFMPIEGTTSGGGSTITQQLIKNITQENEVRVERKVKEIFRALDLSKRYSREEILEAYLNLVPLGNGTNGIQAAANFYFGKNASDLTLSESAAIVGITQYPGRYDPLVNPDKNKDRQLHILKEMLDQKLISEKQYNDARNEELHFRGRDVEQTDSIIQPSSYFVDHVIEEVIADLMETQGMTRAYASERIMKGGYRIYATVDMKMQAYLEEFFLNNEKFPPIYNEEYPQSATIVIDPNGKILATVGGIGEKDGERTFNRATMSRRHPGSAMKPLGTYSLAIEHGYVTWSTIIEDSPLVGAPDNWSPSNYYAGFKGPVTVDEAIQRSINTVAAKVVMILTPRRVFDFLHDELGFTGLVEREVRGNQIFSDVALSPMSLGALTRGVSPMEMAGAYQIFVNGGSYTRPYSYTRVEDYNGNVIMEKDVSPRYVISEDTAVVMNKLLQRVVNAYPGTGTYARLDNMPTAGKTGTSQDDVNQWFMGLTPYYIAPAWLGYDETNKVVVDGNGRRSVVPNSIRYSSYPPPHLWKSMMAPLHADLEPIPFIESPDVISMTYCTVSGDLATSYCPTTGSGWYKKSRLPGHCPMHTSHSDSITDENENGNENSSSSGTSIGSDNNGGNSIDNAGNNSGNYDTGTPLGVPQPIRSE